MSIYIRRRFISLFSNNSNFLREPHPHLSVYFCTSTNKQPGNPDFSESLIQKYHFHPQAAPILASIVTSPKKNQNCDRVLSFFVDSGFSAAQLEKIVKSWPQLLSLNLEKTIKPKFKIFLDFGLSANDIVEIISKDPGILHSSADKSVAPSLSLLKGLLGCPTKVARVLKSSSWYAKGDLDNTVVPNIKYLTGCGIDMDKIFWLLCNSSRILLRKPEYLKKFTEKAEQLGATRSSGMFIHAVRVVSSMKDESWELKLKAFRDVGFSEADILRVFRAAPIVFAVSEEKIKKIKEIIIATGMYNTSCIVRYPDSLCRSIEKKYMPRIQVLKILVEKNLITKWPSFPVLYKKPDSMFYEKFVRLYYDEVGEVFKSMTLVSGKREVHSVPSV